ncbi:hypothetical protein BT63DRAFT_123117 [Microthyrium microscopicum]|uniref:Uncharacterized protein n=1 Tax=Microthyrium microscopicum TaxID=703497 RepID=A0A6A6TT50_9PEZI|nr:hypothetical protein BT63DRAFT_123117 [Microthyrium microscopicum]
MFGQSHAAVARHKGLSNVRILWLVSLAFAPTIMTTNTARRKNGIIVQIVMSLDMSGVGVPRNNLRQGRLLVTYRYQCQSIC